MIEKINKSFFLKNTLFKVLKINNNTNYIETDDFFVKEHIERSYYKSLDFELFKLNIDYPKNTLNPKIPLKKRNVDKLINNTLEYGKVETFDLIRRRLNENETNLAYERGYRLNHNSSPYFLANKYVLKIEIEKYNNYDVLRYIDVDIPNKYVDEFLEKGNIVYNEKFSNEDKKLLNNKYAVRKAVIQYNQAFILQWVEFEIDSELLEYYIKQGNDPLEIRLNSELINEIVFKYKRADVLGKIYCNLTQELVDEFFNQGNKLSVKDSYMLLSNPLVIHTFLHRFKDLSIFDLPISDISDEDLKFAVELGYSPNFELMKRRGKDNGFNDYYLSTIKMTEKMKTMLSLLGKDYFIYCYKDILESEEIFDYFTDNEVYYIIKYYYFDFEFDKKDLKDIIKNGDLSNFSYVYKKINKNDPFNLEIFSLLARNYYKYHSLFKAIQKENKDNYDLRYIYYLFKDDVSKYNIDSYEKLLNYKKIVYNEINEKLNKAKDWCVPRKIISELLFTAQGNDYKFQRYIDEENSMRDFLEEWIDTKKINDLILSINNETALEQLKYLYIIVESIEKIFPKKLCASEDIDDYSKQLKEIAYKLNEAQYNNDEDFYMIKDTLKHLKEICRDFYAEDLYDNLLDLKNLKSKKGIQVKKECFNVNKFEYNNEVIESKKIDYIQVYNAPFVALAHTMNAYGGGGKISYFKNRRTIGKSYICLTMIDETNQTLAGGYTKDIDDVTLLFSDFSLSQYVISSNEDLYSDGYSNSLNVKCEKRYRINVKPVRKLITLKKVHNECVLYRENINGGSLYPSGVLVTGIMPTQEEKQAAAYLGVPLVKLYKKKYFISEKPTAVKDRRCSNVDFSKKYDLERVAQSLQKFFIDEKNINYSK